MEAVRLKLTGAACQIRAEDDKALWKVPKKGEYDQSIIPSFNLLVRPAGFEPAAYGFEVRIRIKTMGRKR
jgi:hypothetical protein